MLFISILNAGNLELIDTSESAFRMLETETALPWK